MITAEQVTIGFGVGTQPPLGRVHNLTRAARVLGFDAIWTVDHFLGFMPQSIWDKDFSWLADPAGSPHAYFDYQVLLGHLASRAGNMQLAVGVTEPIRRHPVLLAQMAMTLSHVSKAPPIIGIGSGEAENTVPYGFDFSRPVSRLEEALELIRMCFDSQGAFRFEGSFYQMDDAVIDLRPKTGNRPQLWVAAHRPRMLDLCGRFGDGWWPALPYTPESYEEAVRTIRRSAARAGRDPAQIVPGWSNLVVVAKTEKEARRMLDTPPLRFLALLAPDYIWQSFGHRHPMGEGFGGLIDFTPQRYDRQTMERAMRLVPVDLVAEAVMWGTPQSMYEGLGDFVDAGLRHISLSPVGALVSRKDAIYSLRAVVSLLRKLRRHGLPKSSSHPN